MINNEIKLEIEFNASASEVFKTWFDNEKQLLITGKTANLSKYEGSRYFVYDGFAYGEIIKLVSGKQILKSWRTTEFSEDMEDSDVEINFVQTTVGCKVTLNQYNIPEEFIDSSKEFWLNTFLNPMQNFFHSLN